MNWRYLLPLAVVLGLGVFLGLGLTRDPTILPSALLDRPAPDFAVTELFDPKQQFQTADLKGQVSVVNAWGSWCTTCLIEHPVLVEMAEKHGITIFGINYNDPERQLALDWLALRGNPYKKVGFDPEGLLAIDWGVAKAPESYVVDANAVVRYKISGAITPEILQKTLLPLMQQLAGASQ